MINLYDKLKDIQDAGKEVSVIGYEQGSKQLMDLSDTIMNTSIELLRKEKLIQAKMRLSDYIKDNAVRNKPTDKYYWMTTDLKVITKYLDTIKELEVK